MKSLKWTRQIKNDQNGDCTAKTLAVSDEYVGKRFDSVISSVTGNISRSQIQKLMSNGCVFVDGKVLGDPSKKVVAPCNVKIIGEPNNWHDYEIIAEDIPLDIIFEDSHIMVINKPSGMVCHPAPGHKSGTLVNAIMHHLNQSPRNVQDCLRPGIVHRLDMDTSGIMLIAKNNEAHYAFSKLFANEKGRKIRRQYTCFIFGTPPEKMGRIETFITRNQKDRQSYTTSRDSGRFAITLYSIENSVYFHNNASISRLNCELLTGRTHQIRVHMKHIGHHIIGDQVYGKSKISSTYPDVVKRLKRQALHSRTLSFIHPISGKFMEYSAELPGDLEELNALF